MPKYAILVDEEAADNLRKLAPKGVEVLSGENALDDIASHVKLILLWLQSLAEQACRPLFLPLRLAKE